MFEQFLLILRTGVLSYFAWCYLQSKTDTLAILLVLQMMILEILSASVPHLLGYLKVHAKDCYNESEMPRKTGILLLFITIGLVLSGAMVCN